MEMYDFISTLFVDAYIHLKALYNFIPNFTFFVGYLNFHVEVNLSLHEREIKNMYGYQDHEVF